MKKLDDIVIYSDDRYYSAFPSVVTRPDGELIVAFRRAPDRRRFFASGCTHADPNSQLVLTRSRDGGRTWSHAARGAGGVPGEPELLHAHPMGGSQDPCMVQLDDGTLVLTSYAWMVVPEEGRSHLREVGDPSVYGWAFTFLGGYVLRSADGGRSWDGPILPPLCRPHARPFPGVSVPTFNRGAMTQGRDGNLYWAVARTDAQVSLDLAVSRDRGRTWEIAAPIADDERVKFNETSMIETPRGDLVAFVRTADFGDHGVVVRSSDGGRTWRGWEDMGVIGHPYHALRLPDGRVFLLYGYRHEPFGVRARVLDPECERFDVPEIVLRDDGGNGDLGYPWASLTSGGRVLAVYYFNKADGTRHIAGTYLQP